MGRTYGKRADTGIHEPSATDCIALALTSHASLAYRHVFRLEVGALVMKVMRAVAKAWVVLLLAGSRM